jgi:phosphomannomutase
MSDINAIFKAYDIRGIFPNQLNTQTAELVGKAYAATKNPKTVAVGQDVRASGKELKKALVKGLLDSGVDVVDIGVITTDQLYFAVGNYGYDGGISVTASHNPKEYNGFKFSERGGAPITSEDLENIKQWIISKSDEAGSKQKGHLSSRPILDDYVESVLSYINSPAIKPMKIVANANFGAVGRGVDKIAERLNLTLDRLNWKEDGTFPKGPPNPLLPESRDETIQQIKASRPDFGVAWDADADRCFFFTGEGEFIPSCYIVALLAVEFLKKNPGAKIIHDLTTAWVVDDLVRDAGGESIANRTGHTFIKGRMRRENAIFAGESSGHFYFKNSFYADNGIVPFLMILEMISETGKSLEQLVRPLMDKYKVSGEMNFKVENPKEIIREIENSLGREGKIDKTDGLVVESDRWRFSVRPSNTEPLFRLNAESRSQAELNKIIERITEFIK